MVSPSLYENGTTYSYLSADESIVTVSETGLVKSVGEGKTSIIINAENPNGNSSYALPVYVNNPEYDDIPTTKRSVISDVVFANPISEIQVGEEYPLYATVTPTNNMMLDNLVYYESSNVDVIDVSYGVIKGISQGTATITVKDIDNTVSKSISITVQPAYQWTETNVYTVSSIDTSNATNTTNDIIAKLEYASTNNYDKIVFPQGTYEITPSVGSIEIPSDLIVDFSNSTININGGDTSLTGYNMFVFGLTKKCINSKLVKAKIYGDRNTNTNPLTSLSEHCVSVRFWDAENCGLEECTVAESPGFNIESYRWTRNGLSEMVGIKEDNIEAGSFDDEGNKITKDKYWRTINPVDVSQLNNSFELGIILGYSGYQYLAARLYDIVFFDENGNMISILRNCCQFYRYSLPTGTKTVHLAFNQSLKPTGTNYEGNFMISLYSLVEPIKCFIKNCTIKDNYALGIAMCGGKNWLMEGNVFSNNGGSGVSADVDYEDGWDSMNGDVWRYNEFNSYKAVQMCCGQNITMRNNIFNSDSFIVDNRVQGFRIYRNLFKGSNISLSTMNESVFSENILYESTYTKGNVYHTGADYDVRTPINY